jgi:hemolysin D
MKAQSNGKSKQVGERRIVTRLRDLEFMSDPDAIEQRPLGGVTRGVLSLMSAMILTAILWASFSQIDEIVVAPGRIVSSTPNLVVQPLDTSVVDSIDVRAGQIVKAGQQLAALDPTFTGADQAYLKGGVNKLEAKERRLMYELHGRSVEKTLNAKDSSAISVPSPRLSDLSPASVSSKSKDDRLQADLRAARESNFRARIKAMQETIERQLAALETNRADQRMLLERLKSLTEIEQMQDRLVAQNFGAKRQLLEARERRQEVDRELTQARNKEVEISKEIESAKAEQTAFQSEWRQRMIEELAETQRERDGINEQLQKAEKRQSLIVLRAPVDAVVLEIPKRSIGSVVREAEPMFTLVPLNVPLEVELQIASPDVGFVKVGDKVRIKLDSFPFQKFGTLQGVITVVSEDAFARDPAAIQSTRQLSGNYYLARVKLESTRLERQSEDVALRPGFTLAGEIKIGERSVMSYFVYPLIGTLDASLRERR